MIPLGPKKISRAANFQAELDWDPGRKASWPDGRPLRTAVSILGEIQAVGVAGKNSGRARDIGFIPASSAATGPDRAGTAFGNMGRQGPESFDLGRIPDVIDGALPEISDDELLSVLAEADRHPAVAGDFEVELAGSAGMQPD